VVAKYGKEINDDGVRALRQGQSREEVMFAVGQPVAAYQNAAGEEVLVFHSGRAAGFGLSLIVVTLFRGDQRTEDLACYFKDNKLLRWEYDLRLGMPGDSPPKTYSGTPLETPTRKPLKKA
jgi:outer membrane protein assembly factor BamE (lipoprotein component of BamABCDE complex)